MRFASLVSMCLLAVAVLFLMPPAQASQPGPCPMSVGSGCCGSATTMYCCSIVACPPPVARCPTTDVHENDVLGILGTYWVYNGPHFGVGTDSDCSADACVSTHESCNEDACSNGTATCCDLDGGRYDCTCQTSSPTEGYQSTAVALPLPHVAATPNNDCTATVTETYDCPNGFWDTTSYLTVGPVHLVADGCAPMCACMPLEVQVLG
ncbi:MAG: hypothetical protein QOJ26_1178 [Thermoplasmata archaeon]|nr:hypothetical protein [Thermoplasmata archaeon]